MVQIVHDIYVASEIVEFNSCSQGQRDLSGCEKLRIMIMPIKTLDGWISASMAKLHTTTRIEINQIGCTRRARRRVAKGLERGGAGLLRGATYTGPDSEARAGEAGAGI